AVTAAHLSPWPEATPQAADEIEITPSEHAEFAVVDEASSTPTEQAAAPAEIDLSEWEDTVTVEADDPAAEGAEIEAAEPVAAGDAEDTDKISETIEEIRVYLTNPMTDQTWAAQS